MKIIKKSLFTAVFLFAFSTAAFAQFEISISVPLGAGISFSKFGNDINAIADIKPQATAGFEYGVHLIPGWYFNLPAEDMGISALLDIGFSYEYFTSKGIMSVSRIKAAEITIDANAFMLSVGVLPKLHIDEWSIGIGAGVKIHMIGAVKINAKDNIGLGLSSSEYLTSSEAYKSAVSPYVKATFDYSIYFSDFTALQLGVYLGYDFGMKLNKEAERIFKTISAVDAGVQIGFRFGPEP